MCILISTVLHIFLIGFFQLASMTFGSSSHQCTVDSFIYTEAGSFPIFSPLGGTIYIIFLDIAFTDQKKVYPEIKLL